MMNIRKQIEQAADNVERRVEQARANRAQKSQDRHQERQRKPRYKQLEDGALVDLARDGDKAAFGELYERYVEKIYHYVYYRTGNHHDAEDLTARVFHRAMGHMETYTDRGVPFQAWLYRIAHNLVANWHRDRGRRKIIPLDEFIQSNLRSEAPERHAEDQEEREALLTAIRRLPEERQQLLIYKFVDHLSNAEIGQIMDRTEGAIKSLYHRTLIALRDDLRAYDPAADVDFDTALTPTERAADRP